MFLGLDRYCVGHNHFLKNSGRQPLNRWVRKYRVCCGREHLFRTIFTQHGCRRANSAGRVNHVIDQHCRLPGNAPNQIEHLGFVVRLTTLVDDCEWGVVQRLCQRSRSCYTADVWRNNHEVFGFMVTLEIAAQHGRCIDVVHRYIEKAAGLRRVDIKYNDSTDASIREHVRYELGRQRLSPALIGIDQAVSSGVPVVRNHGSDLGGVCSSARVDHEK
mmetsp:Transcript_5281/g.14163  ORF Transcript_5281/g.14163 Transcript_5281/m.14163 type:complete len:217 (-) Transcript_5281:345-995(-)